MKTMTILNYQWKDLLRGKWIIGYGIIYLLLTEGLFRFGGGGTKALLSISNVMLLFVPLISLVYGILYLYQSREFVELMLAQPLKRSSLFWGLYGGITMPLSGAFVLGTGIPLFYHGSSTGTDITGMVMVLGLGLMLTLVFTGIGFIFGLIFYNEKIKGLGLALVTWLFLAVLYDGIVLFVVSMFGNYPLEKIVLGLSLLNPIDLARITTLINFDISAMMGYTGAVFNRFFGSGFGGLISVTILFVWLAVPVWRSAQLFKRKDF